MSNLGIENLANVVQVDRMSSGSGMGAGGAVSERRLISEMGRFGMEVPSAGESAKTFAKALEQSLEQVNTDQVKADHAVKDLVAGRTKNIHETLLTVEKADTSLKLMMQVRNKILDAYREIMRMQV